MASSPTLPMASSSHGTFAGFQSRLKTAAEAEAFLNSRQGYPSASSSSNGEPSSAGHSDLFGSRLLREGDDPLSHNAWDHVSPPASYLSTIQSILSTQAQTQVPEAEAQELYHSNAASHWDSFYSKHEHRFFKDRSWLLLEFPELVEVTRPEAGVKRVIEVGCGAGNTVFPLLQRNENPDLTVYATDYSKEAVEVVKGNELYTKSEGRLGHCKAFVWDVTSPAGIPAEIAQDPEAGEGSLDVVVLIFIFSALHPKEWRQAVDNVARLLKPGGIVVLRDYARYDLPQLRFRKGRMLEDNFYVRGDGTRVYFFTPHEMLTIFNAQPPSTGIPSALPLEEEGQGEQATEVKTAAAEADTLSPTDPPAAVDEADYAFTTLQLALDRRMLVNRKENKQMYRCWLQAKFQKNKKGA